MLWLVIAIIAYFLMAVEVILNKFLLASKKVTHPAIYAFYSGILSQFVIFFTPFSFYLLPAYETVISFSGGIFFIYGILFLYFSIRENEAARVVTAIGAVIPIVTWLFSFLFLNEKLFPYQLMGVFTLVLGGLVISVDLRKESRKTFFPGFRSAIAAGFFLAASFTSFKYVYDQEDFLNVFIWTRFGLFIGSISLLLFWPKIIWKSLTRFKKPTKRDYHSGGMFVFVKILGGGGSILLNYAISLGSVTIVNALVSLEYMVVFFLSLLFSHWLPEFFKERKTSPVLAQKVGAIIIIALGLFLVAK